MKLCQEHWGQALNGVPSSRLLVANTLFMQYLLDYITKEGHNPYSYQAEMGDGCPVCAEGEQGEAIWRRAREEASR